MIYYLIAFIIGLGLGWVTAGKRGGNTADKLQYGAVFGMLAMLILLIAVLIAGPYVMG